MKYNPFKMFHKRTIGYIKVEVKCFLLIFLLSLCYFIVLTGGFLAALNYSAILLVGIFIGTITMRFLVCVFACLIAYSTKDKRIISAVNTGWLE